MEQAQERERQPSPLENNSYYENSRERDLRIIAVFETKFSVTEVVLQKQLSRTELTVLNEKSFVNMYCDERNIQFTHGIIK